MTTKHSFFRALAACVICAAALVGCAPEPDTATSVAAPKTVPANDFGASFRLRSTEIREDMLAELTKRAIPHRLNADGTIGYREADGAAIDAAFYYVVGLYAARN